MDPPWPPLLISRSPWNFYQFLSSDVSRSSFLKLPEEIPTRFFFLIFLHRILLLSLRNCLPYSFLFSLLSGLISYFSLSYTAVLLPFYPLFFLSLCGLSFLSVSSRIYFSLVVSPSSRSILAISFSSSPTRWFPTISPSDFLLLLLRPRQGSRREITLINWSISKARSSSTRGYLRIYTLREGRKGVPQWSPVYKPYLYRVDPPPHRAANVGPPQCISYGHTDESNVSRLNNVRVYLPSSILLILQPGGLG